MDGYGLILASSPNAPSGASGVTNTLADGTPVRRFKRYIAKVGASYRKLSWHKPLNITPTRSQHWLSTLNEMLRDGVPVKVTFDHNDPNKAENARGDVVGGGVENDWLYVESDVRGQKNIEIAEANKDVSMEVYPKVTAGNGKTYEDCIAAVTFTPIPVVHGQPIAASLADDDRFYLSLEQNMSPILEKIAQIAGVAEVTESNALSILADIASAKTAAEAKVLKLSQEPDKRYLSMAARTAEGVWDRACDAGVIDVATRDGFKSVLVGTKNDKEREFSKIALSLADEDEALIDLCEKIVKLITANKPVATGGTLPAQLLSRDIPDGGGNAPKSKTIKNPFTGQDVTVSA